MWKCENMSMCNCEYVNILQYVYAQIYVKTLERSDCWIMWKWVKICENVTNTMWKCDYVQLYKLCDHVWLCAYAGMW